MGLEIRRILDVVELSFNAVEGTKHVLQRSQNLNTWAIDGTITGSKKRIRLYRATGQTQQFWRIKKP